LTILLDTNACIAAINGKPAGVRNRLSRLSGGASQTVFMSSIVLFELRYGVAKSTQVERNGKRLDEFLLNTQMLAFDSDDAQRAGEIRATLEAAGTPIGPYDGLIAAQALCRDLLLVTANVREFSRVKGLRWENWAD
jgi:tRNA(fMet)-specific endonuclease VapC